MVQEYFFTVFSAGEWGDSLKRWMESIMCQPQWEVLEQDVYPVRQAVCHFLSWMFSFVFLTILCKYHSLIRILPSFHQNKFPCDSMYLEEYHYLVYQVLNHQNITTLNFLGRLIHFIQIAAAL